MHVAFEEKKFASLDSLLCRVDSDTEAGDGRQPCLSGMNYDGWLLTADVRVYCVHSR